VDDAGWPVREGASRPERRRGAVVDVVQDVGRRAPTHSVSRGYKTSAPREEKGRR
jgi:hypothetical protein